MANLIELVHVNQFLPPDKLTLTQQQLDQELVSTEQSRVLASLGQLFDTSEWISPQSTPSLVKSIIGMRVAARHYNRLYAEDSTEEGSYGRSLLADAEWLIQGLVEGTLMLEDTDLLNPTGGLPSYKVSEPIFLMGERF